VSTTNDVLIGVAACVSAAGGATAAVITALNRRTATTTEKKVDSHDAVLKRLDPESDAGTSH
jgi:hypothetical protein